MNKETYIGLGATIALVAFVGYAVGIYGLISIGISIAFGMLALFLYTRKSKVAKVGAIVIFPEILTKLLMPKNAKRAINDLEGKKNKT